MGTRDPLTLEDNNELSTMCIHVQESTRPNAHLQPLLNFYKYPLPHHEKFGMKWEVSSSPRYPKVHVIQKSITGGSFLKCR